MKTFPLARMIVPSLILMAASFAADTAGAQAPAAALSTCKDGTTSTATGRGACSGHGGVQKASAATPPAASVPPSGSAMKAAAPTTTAAKSTASTSKSTTGNTDPTGATAKCKDGTYSKSKHHSGTCSKHGGVDQWMDGSK